MPLRAGSEGADLYAAFVGGMTFGRVSGEHGLRVAYVTEEAGNLLAAVTWIGFGALALGAALPHVTWRVVVYALLSLTVVRMLPVAIALTKSGARFQTMAFIGWFGPRGLASVVFALLALERSIPQSQTLLTTVVVTVCLSVVLHGLTSVPLVSAYHRWYAALSAAHPGAAEATPTVVPRRRHHSGVGRKDLREALLTRRSWPKQPMELPGSHISGSGARWPPKSVSQCCLHGFVTTGRLPKIEFERETQS